jgi:hypothetical protein
MNPKAEQEDSFIWAAETTPKKTYLRGNFDHQQSSQTHNVFGSGSRNWSSFHPCKIRSSLSHNIGRIRSPTAPHANGNRQYHCHGIQQWHNKTKTHKSNGYAILLDKRQSETRKI